MLDTVIRNGTIINADFSQRADVGIKMERLFTSGTLTIFQNKLRFVLFSFWLEHNIHLPINNINIILH
ncbi:hypothetical protein P5G62_023370 [Neobacillus sp. 179-C4.2 HS]|uniref:Uncharacterized protein n=1 Tax=Neobacillus driksii TaxID=3035913 RepID=A0ABV4Z1U9_9BACI|nr:hypothetical protein [Neobacillus sp. 179.-C4.2 HS]MDP5194635.1 hypothetical protein [Neobacillus sp. 179.-C4.2 HS]